MSKRIHASALILGSLLWTATGQAADSKLRPFVLGTSPAGSMVEVVEATRASLEKEGFEVVGSYSPYPTATILVATSEELKAAAAETTHGGYAAAQRVSVTDVDGKLQVSWANPTYFAAAYRLKSDLAPVKKKLETALGNQKEYGSKDGLTEKSLRKYQYMMGMERFDDAGANLLKEFKTHQEALDAVEAGLKAMAGGVSKVYRIDIPGKEEAVFGVAITKGDGRDEHVMKVADTASVRSTSHLPYEILVSGNKVYHLFMRFRMAVDFPDLTMRTFGKLMSSPKATKDSLKAVVASPKKE